MNSDNAVNIIIGFMFFWFAMESVDVFASVEKVTSWAIFDKVNDHLRHLGIFYTGYLYYRKKHNKGLSFACILLSLFFAALIWLYMMCIGMPYDEFLAYSFIDIDTELMIMGSITIVLLSISADILKHEKTLL